jgi:hypothetical protein
VEVAADADEAPYQVGVLDGQVQGDGGAVTESNHAFGISIRRMKATVSSVIA